MDSQERPNTPAADCVAQLKGCTKCYGKTVALDGINLEVRRGELLAVLGPNGAGKSTAIAVWLGLIEPDSGSATLMGGSPLDVERRRRIGVMMQDVEMAPGMRVRELIDQTASYYRNPLTVDETLALTQTTKLEARVYNKLSGGQKRQAQFAVAVCGRPELLFLDEPTAGLDIHARETMWKAIRRLLNEGCSIVLTTHYLEEAEELADRVVVLAKGQVIATGSVDEVRSLVARTSITCKSRLDVEQVRAWPGVVEASRDEERLRLIAIDAEPIVRRLLEADQHLTHLEVRQAGLAEAFTELTKEAA